jgi:rod shape-determining protein MreC
MIRFFAIVGRRKEAIIFLLALGLSGWMLSLEEPDKLRLAHSVSATILEAGQRGFAWAIHLMNVQRENKHLRQRMAELSLENSMLKEAKLKNVQLRQLLDFTEESQFALRAAEVIGWEPDRTVNSILIDIGQSHGVQRNMPVVSPEGLVGKVYRVLPHVSVVQLLQDPNCRVSAIVQRSRILGIVEWERGVQCLLRHIPVKGDIRVGDVVVTSGMGGIFPKGLIIGSVVTVADEGWELFKQASIRPGVDVSHLEEVFVLIDEDRTKPSAGDRSAAPSIDTR